MTTSQLLKEAIMKSKRYLSILIILSILFSLCLPSYAAQENPPNIDANIQEQMLRILTSVEPEKKNYGLENVDFSSVEIGNEIPAYKVQNGQLVNADIQLFPLLSNKELVSLFYVANLPNGETYVQLSNELVSPITTYTDVNPFAIVYDDNGAYVYTKSSLYFLGKREQSIYSDEDIIRHNDQFPSQVYLNDESFDDNSNNLVSCLTENDLYTIEVIPLTIDAVLNVENFAKSLPSTYAATSAYLPVEIIKQPSGTNICWAIALTSIYNYAYKSSISVESMVIHINGGVDRAMFIEDVFYRFAEVFRIIWLHQYTDTISPDNVLAYLNAGYPLYGAFKRPDNGGHAVVIRGISTTTKTFSVMNPNPTTSGYTAGTISSSNIWTFISGYSGSLYTVYAYAFPAQI